MIHAGDLVIDRERFLVTVHGHPVRLTFLEFNALWAIAEQDGRVIPYERLAEELGDAAVEIFAWGGHACNVTRPDTFNHAALAWLAGIYPEE